MSGNDIGVLAVRLQSADARIREEAASELAQSGTRDAIEALIQAMQIEDVDAAETVLTALQTIPEATLLPVLEAQDVDAPNWKSVARILGRLGTPAAVDLLETALTEGPEDVRITASIALIDAGPHAVPALVRALGHPSPAIRARAAMSLGRMRAAEASDSLIGSISDEYPEVRLEAVLALAGIGAAHAVPALREALHDPAEQVRHTIPVALGEIGSPEALQVLQEATHNEDETLAWMAGWELRQRTAV